MRPHDAEEASQAVERLDHRREEHGIAAVARKNLTHRELEAADKFVGFLLFLIGHVILRVRTIPDLRAGWTAAPVRILCAHAAAV
jgi:hypothetical protein